MAKIGVPHRKRGGVKEQGQMRKMKRTQWVLLVVLLIIFNLRGLAAPVNAVGDKISKQGPVKMNPHPNSLEGKTVLLRWNGKYNGDKFLSRLGEMLIERVKNVKIIKMWEVDSTTAVISPKTEVSEEVASKIAKLKPDIVISAQAD
jgi:hypothetical protein